MRTEQIVRINRRTLSARFRQSALVVFVLGLLATSLLLQTPPTAVAQSSTPVKCSQLIPQVVKSLSASCNNLNPDQVCYGNNALQVEYLDSNAAGPTPVPFQQVGDVTSISSLKTITTAPLNLDTGQWGLAVLKMKAAVPGSVAGQAVTFVLYGDTKVTGLAQSDPNLPTPTPFTCAGSTLRATYLRTQPDLNSQKLVLLPTGANITVTGRLFENTWVQANYNDQTGWLFYPNNLKLSCDVASLNGAGEDTAALLSGSGAFYFSTGVSAQSECSDVPTSGLLIQSESPNNQKVTFRANGADITIGSTVLMSASPNNKMIIAVLQGQAWMRSNGHEQTAVTGQQMSVQLANGPVSGLTDGVEANGSPTGATGFNLNTVNIANDCAIAKALGLKNPCNVPPPPPPAKPPVQPQQPKAGPTLTPMPATGQPQANAPACIIQNFSANPNPAPLNRTRQALAFVPPAFACSTISWDVEGVNTVAFNGQGVVGHGSQQVCVKQATNYSLTANCQDGSSKSAGLTLNVK